ncbi:proSAAS [Eublepharis macularius]|uniref:ProSAAS n=1 Tax=Eublepharis macularius TaxID=481883 RepID=A0AA97LKJ1_EUBMA|nr:proSAAS [Eublepharis macularius]
MEFQAMVIAVGGASRVTVLPPRIPKALLPVSDQPLLTLLEQGAPLSRAGAGAEAELPARRRGCGWPWRSRLGSVARLLSPPPPPGQPLGRMGPALLLALLSGLGAAKPFTTAGSSRGGLNHNLSVRPRQVRRDLQGVSYEPVETMLANEAYYPELVQLAALERAMSPPGGQRQDERLAQAFERALASSDNQLQDERLAQALERAAVPPSGNQFQPDEHLALALQRLLQDGHRRDQESVYLANLLRLWDEAKGAVLYPDYDETSLAVGSSPPRASPNRYWVPEGAFEPQEEMGVEEEPAREVDPEMLRYLVGKILSSTNLPPQRLPVSPKRLRRALFDGEDLPEPPSLLRVKRLGVEAGGQPQLQRVKRTEGERAKRKKGVTGAAQRLRYLPE